MRPPDEIQNKMLGKTNALEALYYKASSVAGNGAIGAEAGHYERSLTCKHILNSRDKLFFPWSHKFAMPDAASADPLTKMRG